MMLFRTRVRLSNAETVLVAETKMRNLFYARNLSVYREIIYEFFEIENLMLKQ